MLDVYFGGPIIDERYFETQTLVCHDPDHPWEQYIFLANALLDPSLYALVHGQSDVYELT